MDKKKVIRIIFIPVVIMMIGYMLLVMVYLIPDNIIMDGARESSDILSGQGTYPTGYIDGWFLDNWTDADCISVTINKSSKNPFYNALNAFQLGGEKDPWAAGIEALSSTVNNGGKVVGDHSYLWHGYRIWLRTLMIKYNVKQIRTFIYFVTIVLITFVCGLFIKVKKSILAFVPFLLTVTYFNFQMESLSLLFFTDICIMLIGIIAVILFFEKNMGKYMEEIFSFLGALVAFSSMTIIPIVTLGLPLLVLLLLNLDLPVKDNIGKSLKCSFSWGIGYGITLISKIIWSKLFIQSGQGVERVLSYSGIEDKYTLVQRLEKVKEVFLHALNRSEIMRDMVCVLAVFLFCYIVIRQKGSFKQVRKFIPLMIVAVFPCVWCFVCVLHTGHLWTSWNYCITWFAFFQILWEMCGFDDSKWLRL